LAGASALARIDARAESLREWLPEDHRASFVIDAVAAMDLAAF
jgi:hypothetical protein